MGDNPPMNMDTNEDDDYSMSWLDDLPDLLQLHEEILEYQPSQDNRISHSVFSDSFDYSTDDGESFYEDENIANEAAEAEAEPQPGCSTEKTEKKKKNMKLRVEDLINSERVVIFTRHGCPRSETTKELLLAMKLTFEVYEIDDFEDKDSILLELNRMTGKKTIPKVFMEGKYYGSLRQVEKALTRDLVYDISPFDHGCTRSSPNLPRALYSKLSRRPFDTPKTKYPRNTRRSVSV